MWRFLNKRIKSFGYAFSGILAAAGQTNFRIQLVAAIITIILGFVLNISNYEWLIVILLCGLVLTVETINTAIEKIVDFISPNWDTKAGIIKDLAAGAVLIISIVAFVAGIIIFLPKFINQL